MIRILHYGMSSNLGGIEMFIMNLYRNIDRSKIQFDFLTFDQHIYFEDEINELGGKIYRLTPRSQNIFKNYMEIKKFFEQHNEYKTIHYHINTCSFMTPLRIASKKSSLKIITHSHSEWKGSNKATKILHILNKSKMNKSSNYKLACSEVAGKYMFGNNICNDDDYKEFPNSIDTNQFIFDINTRKNKRKEFNVEGKFVIGHIGRFTYAKNHEFLIDIFNEVYKINKNAILLLVGEGELKEEIYSKVKTFGLLESVKFLGLRSDINEILNAMDVFLLPSHFEGFGIVALESQASGLRTIVSDVTPKEVDITNLVEFISLEEDAKYWANKIMKYQDGYKRRNMYNEIVSANYDVKENIKWLEQFYLELNKKK